MAAPYRGDTQNKFMVGQQGDRVVILRPPVPGAALKREDAQLLAAWLIVITRTDPNEMVDVMEHITKMTRDG